MKEIRIAETANDALSRRRVSNPLLEYSIFTRQLQEDAHFARVKRGTSPWSDALMSRYDRIN